MILDVSGHFLAILDPLSDAARNDSHHKQYQRGRSSMSQGSIKPLIGGAVGGAIVMTIVLFASGWAVTSGASESNAENVAREAVVSELAKICVAQSKKDPTLEASTKSLSGMSSWTRGDFVKEKGWAVMPGIDTPDDDVMTECGRLVGGAT